MNLVSFLFLFSFFFHTPELGLVIGSFQFESNDDQKNKCEYMLPSRVSCVLLCPSLLLLLLLCCILLPLVDLL